MGESNKKYVMAKISGDSDENFFVFAREIYNPLKGIYYKEILPDTKMETGKLAGTVRSNLESGLLYFEDSLLIHDIRYITYEQVLACLKLMDDEYTKSYIAHIYKMKNISDIGHMQVQKKTSIKSLKKKFKIRKKNEK